jgi:phosphoglycolate phosphatase
MLKTAFQLTDQDAQLTVLKANLFELYRQHLAEQTQPFAGINELLITLEQNNLAWGIVTNKPSYLTQQLLSQLNFGQQAGAIVCADQVANPKPDPEALLVACEKMAITPQQAIYIGDHQRDIKAGNAAGMFTIAACYGYLEDHHQPEQWQADYLVDSVLQLRQLIDQLTMPCESAV